jgi:FKBP-type peptidyl-prolyl cis-trans isomerase SlyD
MPIQKDTVVTLKYSLYDDQGTLIESSAEEPINYIHGGYDGIFPAVEAALDGKDVGFTTKMTLEPEEAFGDYDDELVRVEAKESFPDEIEAGMRFESQEDGLIYSVVEIDAETKQVVLDGNHPLAGMTVQFECEVLEVRPATPEEIEHAHVHDGTEDHGDEDRIK